MTEIRLFGVRMALNVPSGQSLKWILYCDHELHYVLDDQGPSADGFRQSFSVYVIINISIISASSSLSRQGHVHVLRILKCAIA